MGQTGDGKSALMRQFAEAGAKAGGAVLAVFGEDPEEPTAERQLSADTGLDTAAVGRLDLTQEDLDNLDLAAERASGWAGRVLPVFETLDVDGVLDLIDEVTTIGGAPLREVLLDYAQIFGGSRTLEDDIARLGKGLHARARPRGIAVAIGSQVVSDVIRLARERWYASKDISRICPALGDTEWSRRLEKLSKVVLGLCRPGRWRREFGDEEAADDYAELHVRKASFGPTGWVQLGWDARRARFTNP